MVATNLDKGLLVSLHTATNNFVYYLAREIDTFLEMK